MASPDVSRTPSSVSTVSSARGENPTTATTVPDDVVAAVDHSWAKIRQIPNYEDVAGELLFHVICHLFIV